MRTLLYVAVLCLSGLAASAQEFASSPKYVAFYKARFAPEFEASSEPTIAFWWIVERLGDVDTPRSEIRDMLTRYVERYPDSPLAPRAKSDLVTIKRMMHEKRPSNDTKIERLIFDLRDLNFRQFHQPNRGLSIVGNGALGFEGSVAKRDTAEQLRDIDFDALPLLIDHIDDDTLTRSVDYGRNFTFSHRVLTVGDCCRQIVNAILPTGREFDFSGDPELAKQAMKTHYRHLVAQKKAEPSIEAKPTARSK